jgi:hypothetical protein
VPKKPGVLIYSANSAQIPFQGGTLWLALPIKRGPTFTLDTQGFFDLGLPIDATLVGTTRYYQAWYRDPAHPDGTATGLSNGGRTVFGP